MTKMTTMAMNYFTAMRTMNNELQYVKTMNKEYNGIQYILMILQ